MAALPARTPFVPPKTADQLRREIRVPELDAAVAYALIRRPEAWLEKPVAYAGLGDLVAAIHRDRRGADLQLADVTLQLRGEDRRRPGVSLWTLGADGERQAFLGWAWLRGAGSRALQAALFEAQPHIAGRGV